MGWCIYLSQDSLLDELVHQGLTGRVGAESEERGHALILLLGQVVFVEQLVRRLRPETVTMQTTYIVGLDTSDSTIHRCRHQAPPR